MTQRTHEKYETVRYRSPPPQLNPKFRGFRPEFFFSLNEKLKIIVCTWNYAQIVGIVETNNFYK